MEGKDERRVGCSRFRTPTPTVLLMLMSVVEGCRVSSLQKACKARERVSRREGMVLREEKRLTWLWREKTDLIVEGRLTRTPRETTD
jgi:hypothetical protein